MYKSNESIQLCLDAQADEALCALAASGVREAEEVLVTRYGRLVRTCARPFFLVGGDSEDLIQEGMIGLFLALREYNPDREASFRTYANICIAGQMNHAIAAASRDKHKPLNGAVSLDVEQNDGEGNTLENLLINMDERDPENLYIDQENVTDLMGKIKNSLSELEWQVFCMYVNGDNYKNIAAKLGKSDKSIDNALNRIKNKTSALL